MHIRNRMLLVGTILITGILIGSNGVGLAVAQGAENSSPPLPPGEAEPADPVTRQPVKDESRNPEFPVTTTGATSGTVTTNKTLVIDNNTYVIGVGDKLNYKVQEYPADQKILVVSPSGEIDIPQLRRVRVAGKTILGAAREIKSLLEKEIYYTATVALGVEELAVRPSASATGSGPSASAGAGGVRGKLNRVIVVGQVKSPGIQEIPPDEKFTVSLAIVRAGGFSSFAQDRKVQVVRRGEEGLVEKIEVDVRSILLEGKLDNDFELKPDDLIIVPEKLIRGF